MPVVEILDGPPEWAGTVYETDEDMVADEIGMSHPGWRGTPVGIRWSALCTYRKVEVVGDRHRYRYLGPWGPWHWSRRRRHGEDLTGWDVLVVQKELGSDDRRKLWGSPIRVYVAPPGILRPDPARPPEAQGWQELTEGGLLRHPRAPGTGTFYQERLAAQVAEGNPWVVGHWRRLADQEGAAKDAEVDWIEAEQSRMVRVARAARELGRLQPEEVRSWTSDPPFPARTTYIPMIGEDLARIRGLGEREWMALQDRVLLVVHPDRTSTTTTAGCTASPSCTAPRRPPSHRIRRSRPRSRAGPSWRRGISSCPGCSTSRCMSSANANVARRSARRRTAADAGFRLVRSTGSGRRTPDPSYERYGSCLHALLGAGSWVRVRCRPRHREAKLEAGAAAAGRSAEPQVAAVGEGQPPGDVQPQSQPAGRSGGLVCPPVPLEDPLGGLGGDAGSLVVDGQDRLGAVAAAEQLDLCAGWGVGGGVVEQVAQDANDGQRVGVDWQRPSNLDGEVLVGEVQLVVVAGARGVPEVDGAGDQRAGRPCEGLRCAVVPCLPLLGCLWSGRSSTWRCATSLS